MSNPVELVGGIAIGTGVGAAVGATVTPKLQEFLNEQWSKYPNRPPSVGTMASGVAQGQVPYADALAWAESSGFGKPQFDALVNVANVGPGSAYAFELWRRGEIGEDGFRRAVKRLGLEQEWIDDLVKIKQLLLTPAELAVMIQRTVVANPGILPNQPSTAGSNVPPMPEVGIDPVAEAAGSGVNAERLAALARIIGLPASPDLAARMHFRKIITEGAFNQAILEGNTRGEWAPFLLEGFRDILTSGQYVERQIRGFTDRAGRLKDTEKHGMSDEDSDKLYEVLGRSPSIHTLVVGLARGGKYPGSYAAVPEPFRSDIQRSNIREEFAEVAYAARYNYPSAFVLRALAEAGDLGNTAAVEQILLEIGWKPSLAAQVAGKWTPKGATADPYVKKAQTQLWTTTHTSYKAQEIDDAAARGSFNLLGISTAAQTEILALWGHERGLIRAQLSPADVRKAYQQADLNAATGAAWTRDEAFTALLDRGWGSTDANDYLNIPYKG